MKLPEWTAKQKILIGALLGLLLCALVFLLVLMTLPAQSASAYLYNDSDPDPEAYDPIEEDLVLSKDLPTLAPDLALTFRKDDAQPMPEDGAVLSLGEAFSIGGTIYSNYPLESVTAISSMDVIS